MMSLVLLALVLEPGFPQIESRSLVVSIITVALFNFHFTSSSIPSNTAATTPARDFFYLSKMLFRVLFENKTSVGCVILPFCANHQCRELIHTVSLPMDLSPEVSCLEVVPVKDFNPVIVAPVVSVIPFTNMNMNLALGDNF